MRTAHAEVTAVAIQNKITFCSRMSQHLYSLAMGTPLKRVHPFSIEQPKEVDWMKPPYFPQYWNSIGTVPLESLGGHSSFTIVLKSLIGVGGKN